jgi:hypothetical protein
MSFDDPTAMIRWTVALAALSSLVMAAELVFVALRRRAGVFWRCCHASLAEGGLGSSAGPSPSPVGRARSLLGRSMPLVLWLYALAAAATLGLAAAGLPYRASLFVLTAASLAVARWRAVGGDGASQMTLIVLTACSLGLLGGGDGGGGAQGRGPASALWFVGLQGLLAYVVAGVAKAVSAEWRNEDVVYKIASTVSYGSGRAARAMESAPGLGRALTLAVIAFELSMPLAVLVPVPATVGFLAVALLFHVGCAAVMGLNDFVWAFASTFPGILFISSTVRHLMA